ncbi:hypothetical protein M427DRAFT_35472 [Gonapodya prolifera JEL478]|uniref:CKK domain-containing protein n=1 Tax=Gonapodya prolifera (strain JEL478) TaxID=1344416 RepID=A0A139A4M9_GONPJ|nr:hypothetical protein M427DRAFT_35472 [Gonapodya prolifera JEL478]|eukprot:KXS11731.1 hypothetical protein M427DRAFT_35472 [Gonapodya prolifera JEL478]
MQKSRPASALPSSRTNHAKSAGSDPAPTHSDDGQAPSASGASAALAWLQSLLSRPIDPRTEFTDGFTLAQVVALVDPRSIDLSWFTSDEFLRGSSKEDVTRETFSKLGAAVGRVLAPASASAAQDACAYDLERLARIRAGDVSEAVHLLTLLHANYARRMEHIGLGRRSLPNSAKTRSSAFAGFADSQSALVSNGLDHQHQHSPLSPTQNAPAMAMAISFPFEHKVRDVAFKPLLRVLLGKVCARGREVLASAGSTGTTHAGLEDTAWPGCIEELEYHFRKLVEDDCPAIRSPSLLDLLSSGRLYNLAASLLCPPGTGSPSETSTDSFPHLMWEMRDALAEGDPLREDAHVALMEKLLGELGAADTQSVLAESTYLQSESSVLDAISNVSEVLRTWLLALVGTFSGAAPYRANADKTAPPSLVSLLCRPCLPRAVALAYPGSPPFTSPFLPSECDAASFDEAALARMEAVARMVTGVVFRDCVNAGRMVRSEVELPTVERHGSDVRTLSRSSDVRETLVHPVSTKSTTAFDPVPTVSNKTGSNLVSPRATTPLLVAPLRTRMSKRKLRELRECNVDTESVLAPSSNYPSSQSPSSLESQTQPAESFTSSETLMPLPSPDREIVECHEPERAGSPTITPNLQLGQTYESPYLESSEAPEMKAPIEQVNSTVFSLSLETSKPFSTIETSGKELNNSSCLVATKSDEISSEAGSDDSAPLDGHSYCLDAHQSTVDDGAKVLSSSHMDFPQQAVKSAESAIPEQRDMLGGFCQTTDGTPSETANADAVEAKDGHSIANEESGPPNEQEINDSTAVSNETLHSDDEAVAGHGARTVVSEERWSTIQERNDVKPDNDDLKVTRDVHTNWQEVPSNIPESSVYDIKSTALSPRRFRLQSLERGEESKQMNPQLELEWRLGIPPPTVLPMPELPSTSLDVLDDTIPKDQKAEVFIGSKEPADDLCEPDEIEEEVAWDGDDQKVVEGLEASFKDQEEVEEEQWSELHQPNDENNEKWRWEEIQVNGPDSALVTTEDVPSVIPEDLVIPECLPPAPREQASSSEPFPVIYNDAPGERAVPTQFTRGEERDTFKVSNSSATFDTEPPAESVLANFRPDHGALKSSRGGLAYFVSMDDGNGGSSMDTSMAEIDSSTKMKGPSSEAAWESATQKATVAPGSNIGDEEVAATSPVSSLKSSVARPKRTQSGGVQQQNTLRHDSDATLDGCSEDQEDVLYGHKKTMKRGPPHPDAVKEKTVHGKQIKCDQKDARITRPSSTRTLIKNALHALLAGALNENTKREALAAIEVSTADSFIIAVKEERDHKFRALYELVYDHRGLDQSNAASPSGSGLRTRKLCGTGPSAIDEGDVAAFMKYDTGSRQLRVLPTKGFGVSTHAVAIGGKVVPTKRR